MVEIKKRYAIKETFVTLQGEGLRAGTKAVFCRFAGCDLWSGSEEGRAHGKGACALWCDTQFVGGVKHTVHELLSALDCCWPASGQQRWVVLTGGEPSLQIDDSLVSALQGSGWKIAVETNGCYSNEAVKRCDHICISPKRARTGGVTDWWKLGTAHEIKVVLPGAAIEDEGWSWEELEAIEKMAYGMIPRPHLFVQPQDPIAVTGPNTRHLAVWRGNTQRCIDFVMAHPSWRLSYQLHKIWNLP